MIICGDCVEELKKLPENSVDSIVTDPPYELGFMGKGWDRSGIANSVEMWGECLRVLKPGGHLLSFGGTRTYHRMACAIEDAGFEIRDMVEWVYSTGFPKSLNVWKALKRKCECGNMEVYEKRVQLQRTMGESETEHYLRFLREANLSQTINAETEQGKVLFTGLSEQSTHGSMQGEKPKKGGKGKKKRVLERRDNLQKTEGKLQGGDLPEMPEGISTNGEKRRLHNATQISDGSTLEQVIDEDRSSASQRPQSEQQQYREPCAFCKQFGTQAIRTLGTGTAIKPAHEPIVLARKPLSEKSVAENVLKWKTGGLNIDESRVESNEKLSRPFNEANNQTFGKYERFGNPVEPVGRFPANLIHDGSEEVRECFPETKSAGNKNKSNIKASPSFGIGGIGDRNPKINGDNGGNASRFFKSIIYTAKASKAERNRGCEDFYWLNGKLTTKEIWEKLNKENEENKDNKEFKKHPIARSNIHPTVKTIALCEYLIKMITPKGGIVLDPFAGSGSTLIAAKQNGYKYIGIEKEEEYVKITEARLKAVPKRLL